MVTAAAFVAAIGAIQRAPATEAVRRLASVDAHGRLAAQIRLELARDAYLREFVPRTLVRLRHVSLRRFSAEKKSLSAGGAGGVSRTGVCSHDHVARLRIRSVGQPSTRVNDASCTSTRSVG